MVWNPFKWFQDEVVEPVSNFLSRAAQAIGSTFEKIVNTVGKTVEGILKNPLPTIATIGLTAIGVPPPLANAMVTAATGGDMEQIVFSAAASYAGGKIGQQIGGAFAPDQVVGGAWGDEAFSEVFKPDLSQQMLQKIVTDASSGAARAALQGKDFNEILSAGVSGAVSSRLNTALKMDFGLNPNDLPSKLISDSISSATKAILANKDPATAIGDALGKTLITGGLEEAVSEFKTTANELKTAAAKLDQEDETSVISQAQDLWEEMYGPQGDTGAYASLNDLFDDAQDAVDGYNELRNSVVKANEFANLAVQAYNEQFDALNLVNENSAFRQLVNKGALKEFNGKYYDADDIIYETRQYVEPGFIAQGGWKSHSVPVGVKEGSPEIVPTVYYTKNFQDLNTEAKAREAVTKYLTTQDYGQSLRKFIDEKAKFVGDNVGQLDATKEGSLAYKANELVGDFTKEKNEFNEILADYDLLKGQVKSAEADINRLRPIIDEQLGEIDGFVTDYLSEAAELGSEYADDIVENALSLVQDVFKSTDSDVIFPQARDFTPDELRDLGLGGGDDLQRGSVDLTDLSGLESVFGPIRPAAPPAAEETNEPATQINEPAAEETNEPETGFNEEDINRLLDTRLGDLDMLSEEDVSELMREELSKLDFATEEDIQAVIDAALEADPSLTEEDISRLLDDQLKELDIPTDVDIKNVVAGELDKLDLLSKEDVSEVVSQELAGLDFATAEDIQAAIDAALEANPNLSEDDISRLLDDQLKELDIPTDVDIRNVVSGELGKLDLLSETEVSEIISQELSGLDFASAEDVQAAINAALEANPNLSEEDISRLLDAQLKELDIPTDVDIKSVVAGELGKLDLLSEEDVAGVVSKELEGLDFASAEDVQRAIDAALEANPNLTEDDISRLLDAELDKLNIPTDVDIQDVVSKELGKLDLLSEEDVSEVLSRELAGLDFASEEDVQRAIDAALEANPNLSEDDISRLLDAELDKLDLLTDADVAEVVDERFKTIEAGLETFDTRLAGAVDDITTRINEYEAYGATRDEALDAAIDNVAEELGLTKDQLLEQLGETADTLGTRISESEAKFAEQITGVKEALTGTLSEITARINEYEGYGATRAEAMDAAIDGLATELGLTKDQFLEQLGETEESLNTRITDFESKFAEEIGGVRTELSGAVSDITSKINEFEALGATRDEALDAAISNVAEELGLTKDQFLSQLGETEESLGAQIAESEAKFAEQLAGVETGLGEQITGVKTELTGALGDINSRIEEYEAYGATRDEALNAAIESVADELGLTRDDLLSQLGETASSLETKFQTGLTGLGEEVGKRFETVESGLETFGTRLTGAVDDITARINEYEAYGATRDEALSAALDNVAEDLGLTRSDLLDQLGETQESLNTRISESEAKFAEQFGGLGEQVTGLGTEVSGIKTGLGQLGTQVGQQVQGLQTGLGQLEKKFSNQLFDLQGRLMQQAEQPIYNLPYYFQLPEQSEEEKFDITKAFSPTLYRLQKE